MAIAPPRPVHEPSRSGKGALVELVRELAPAHCTGPAGRRTRPTSTTHRRQSGGGDEAQRSGTIARRTARRRRCRARAPRRQCGSVALTGCRDQARTKATRPRSGPGQRSRRAARARRCRRARRRPALPRLSRRLASRIRIYPRSFGRTGRRTAGNLRQRPHAGRCLPPRKLSGQRAPG